MGGCCKHYDVVSTKAKVSLVRYSVSVGGSWKGSDNVSLKLDLKYGLLRVCKVVGRELMLHLSSLRCHKNYPTGSNQINFRF